MATSATTIANSSPQLDDGLVTANALSYAGSGGIVAQFFNATGATGAYKINGTIVLFQPDGDTLSIGVGQGALAAQSSINLGNIAVGYHALFADTSGNNNTAMGYQALLHETTGSQSTAMGSNALGAQNGGSVNVAIGYTAGQGITTGFSNTAVGAAALTGIATNYNVAIGYQALQITTGSANVGIGANAATALTSGTNNIFIGYGTVASAITDTNEIVIGYTATGSGSNTTVIGNVSATDAYFGSATGASNIHGAVYYSGGTAGITQTAEAVGTLATKGGIVTTFTAVSDERLKNFVPYNGGLKELLGITPIRYRWNEKGQELSGQSGERDYVGFSANNVQKSIPEAIQGYKGPERYLSFDDRPVLAATVNAIRELHAIVKAQNERIKELENK
jgi:hypothetical protein